MEKFKHHPLCSSNCTRVLLLHPSPDPSGPLIGDLRERPLVSSSSSLIADEQYEALSYVWGPPSKEHGIIIHDKWLDLTANCDAALRYLRQESTPRVLWVDAICIDQEASAVAERSAQVAMMGDIYHAASSTILWLGPGGAEAETVFEFLSLYARALLVDSELQRFVLSRFRQTSEEKHNVTAEQLFRTVSCSEWFQRMWTLQELLLSVDPIVMCGRSKLEWSTFKFSATAFAELRLEAQSMGLMQCMAAYDQFNHPLRAARAAETRNEWDHTMREGLLEDLIVADREVYSSDISDMLHWTRHRKAKMPEDMVFALFSVVQKFSKSLQIPDYKKSIPDIYAEATVACLQQDSSYAVLEHIWSRTRRPDLPSWVPDFSDESFITPPHQSLPGGIGKSLIDRTGSTLQARAENRKLHVHIRTLGVISALAPGADADGMKREIDAIKNLDAAGRATRSVIYKLRVIRGWSDLANKLPVNLASSTHTQDRRTTFYRTLLGLTSLEDSPELRQQFATWDEFIRSHETKDRRQWLKDLACTRLGSSRAESVFIEDVDPDLTLISMMLDAGVIEEEATEFTRHLIFLLYDVTMFLTKDGVFGFAFGDVQEGDMLVHLAFCRSPLLLRRSTGKDEYVLLSPTFSHGLQFGPEKPEVQFPKQDFQEIVLI